MSVLTNYPSVYKIDNPYQLYVDYAINRLLNAEELALYNLINNCYASCFVAAKQKNPDLASQHLYEGNLLSKKASFNVNSLVAVFCMPYISYYYYKIGNFGMAVRESDTIIENVIELEKKGHEYLFFCRIQQEQNLGRIHWANNDTMQSIKIYAKCVLDIYAKSACWKTNQVINDVPVMILVENTQYSFFIQVITEILNRIIQKYFKDISLTLSWLQLFFKPLTLLDFESLSRDTTYKSFKDYITIFEQLIAGHTDLFIASANHFLDNPLYDEEMKKVICRYLYRLNYIED